MPKNILALLSLLVAGFTTCDGQRVKWKAFRLTEENEFFNVTQRGIDRYYTQGMRFEFTYQASDRKLLEKILIPVSSISINAYSVSLSQQIFTPKLTDSYFFVGDMPYASTLYFSESLESLDTTTQFRLSTRIDAGLIGPLSFGEQTQLLFHKIINNDLAVGWGTQLRNDIYLNYSFKAEKALTKSNSLFKVEGKGELNLGTVLISAVPGVNFSINNWLNRSKKFSWQVFFKPEARLVFFNALLQGGLLNQTNAGEFYSQYFINKIKPVVYSHSMGFRIRYNKFEFLYRQVNLTREFTGQQPHYYSTLMFAFPLK